MIGQQIADENASVAGKRPPAAARGLGGKAKGLSGAGGGGGGLAARGGGAAAGKQAGLKPRRALGDISNRDKAGASSDAPAKLAQKPASLQTSCAGASTAPADLPSDLPPVEHYPPACEEEPALPTFDRSGIVPEESVAAALAAGRDCRPLIGSRTPSRTSLALSPSATPGRLAGLIEAGPTPARPFLADALDAAGACWTEAHHPPTLPSPRALATGASRAAPQAEQLEAALAISLSDYAAEGGGDTAGGWPFDGPADGQAAAHQGDCLDALWTPIDFDALRLNVAEVVEEEAPGGAPPPADTPSSAGAAPEAEAEATAPPAASAPQMGVPELGR